MKGDGGGWLGGYKMVRRVTTSPVQTQPEDRRQEGRKEDHRKDYKAGCCTKQKI